MKFTIEGNFPNLRCSLLTGNSAIDYSEVGGMPVNENIESYVETRKRRIRRDAMVRDARISEARLEIEELVADLRRIDPEIRKITLFGSLATGRAKSRWFDIDIAVDCAPQKYLDLVARALRSRFDVDVVEIRTCREGLLRAIERDGEVLYER